MLTIKQNLLETIHGGTPDRLVNQYEYLGLIGSPMENWFAIGQGESLKTEWGYTLTWIEGTPGPMPFNHPIKDIENWKDIITAPDPHGFSDEDWAPYVQAANEIDRNEIYVAPMRITGIFERMHYLLGIDECLIDLYEEPECIHGIIDYILEWELEYAEVYAEKLNPNALFMHDDWGTQINSFFSPEVFEEFFYPAYKKLYARWRELGAELIVHHADCYMANLVPYMIELDLDIWQGAMANNDIPALIKEYGGRLSFHGGMDNGIYDTEDWSREKIRKGLGELVEACGTKYFIPGGVMGGPDSTYPGVYETMSEEIDALSQKIFV